jgi:plastocyanin
VRHAGPTSPQRRVDAGGTTLATLRVAPADRAGPAGRVVAGRRRAWWPLPLALAAALLAAGCGGDDASAKGPAPAGDLTIVEKDYKFVPDEVRVPAGREVTVVIDNRDPKTAHNIHFTTLPGSPKTKLELGPGYQTIKVRFDTAGRYPFICDVHPGMTGTAVAG